MLQLVILSAERALPRFPEDNIRLERQILTTIYYSTNHYCIFGMRRDPGGMSSRVYQNSTNFFDTIPRFVSIRIR